MNVVVRQVQLDEYLQATECVFVDQLDRTIAGDQLVQVDQAHLSERVLIYLQYFIVGQVKHLHFVAQGLGYAGEARIDALGHLLATDPFAPARLLVAHGDPVQFGCRVRRDGRPQQQHYQGIQADHCLRITAVPVRRPVHR